ncbi:putative HVA22-like protein g [Drosophila elegans]|uniref:putative HVA22-like protein g n=1 Tax=Drosophila elegans TaxID=30023 RepID=UPI0007E76DD1|nr:putative HVA22-like protein g [Drosophila elegans]
MLRLVYIYYGTLCPGWTTLRALGQGQRHFIVLWLKYWVIYALLQGFGVLTDFLIGWLPYYAALKLILSICLWFSAPYSTNHLYNFITKYVMEQLEPIIDRGFRWHGALVRKNFHKFMQLPLVLTVIPRDLDEQRMEPRLNDDLLKRELTHLMAEIEKDEADKRRRHKRCMNLCTQNLAESGKCPNQTIPLDGLDRESMHNIIDYLTQRLEDQQPGDNKPSIPLRRSKRIKPGHAK